MILKHSRVEEKRLSIYTSLDCQHFIKEHRHLANSGNRGGSGARAEDRNQQLF